MMIIPFTAKTENYYFFKHLKSLFNHVFLLGLVFSFWRRSSAIKIHITYDTLFPLSAQLEVDLHVLGEAWQSPQEVHQH